MREIGNLTRFLGKTIFQKETETINLIDEDGGTSDSGFLYVQLTSLVKQGNINEAEDKLFQEIRSNPSDEFLRVACTFYDNLNHLSDERLLECGFSREEIAQGISDIKRLCTEL